MRIKAFPSSPVVKTWHFHCRGPGGSILGEGTKSCKPWYGQNKKERKKENVG